MSNVRVVKPGGRVITVPWWNKKPIGFGDLIAKATTAVGIVPCSSCKKRRKLLNRIRFGR